MMTKLISLLLMFSIASDAMTQDDAFPSTYAAPTAEPTLLQNATILTGDGRRLDDTNLLLAGGKIV